MSPRPVRLLIAVLLTALHLAQPLSALPWCAVTAAVGEDCCCCDIEEVVEAPSCCAGQAAELNEHVPVAEPGGSGCECAALPDQPPLVPVELSAPERSGEGVASAVQPESARGLSGSDSRTRVAGFARRIDPGPRRPRHLVFQVFRL